MKRRAYTARQVAIARAAKEARIPAPVVSELMGIPTTVLNDWNVKRGRPWPHVEPDPAFPERLRALFQP